MSRLKSTSGGAAAAGSDVVQASAIAANSQHLGRSDLIGSVPAPSDGCVERVSSRSAAPGAGPASGAVEGVLLSLREAHPHDRAFAGAGGAGSRRIRSRSGYRGFPVVSTAGLTENPRRDAPARAGPGLSMQGTTTAMPITIARTEPMPAAEYTYRDRMLLVTRGSPLPPGATPTPNGIN